MRVYQIISESAGLCYIGATTLSLEERLLHHRMSKIRFDKGLTNRTTSFEVLKHSDARIEELEVCDNREHLRERERFHIKQNDCVNICIPGRDHREYHIDHKEAIHARKKRKIRCSYCEKCISSANMAAHIRRVHTDTDFISLGLDDV